MPKASKKAKKAKDDIVMPQEDIDEEEPVIDEQSFNVSHLSFKCACSHSGSSRFMILLRCEQAQLEPNNMPHHSLLASNSSMKLSRSPLLEWNLQSLFSLKTARRMKLV